MDETKNLKEKIKKIAKNVYEELGGSNFLGEKEFQRALAVEMKKNNLKYLREPNVEILYKGENIRAEGGEIDFIVFDEHEENGILVEIKHTSLSEKVIGSGVSQALIYLKFIKESTFPKFIGEKIKSALVINFADEGTGLGKKLFDSISHFQPKNINKIWEKYLKDIEIWNIKSSSSEKEDQKKKTKNSK